MKRRRTLHARAITRQIRHILYIEWDPFRAEAYGAPVDEYDFLIAPLYRLLLTRPPRDALAEYLAGLLRDESKLSTAPRAELLSIADRLLAIDITNTP